MPPELYAGDDDRLEFTITQSDGSALDLTNMSIVWQLADRAAGPALITKDSANAGEIAVVDTVGGRFDVLLDPADTADLSGSFYHEVELTDVDGNEFTVFDGRLFIKPTLVE